MTSESLKLDGENKDTRIGCLQVWILCNLRLYGWLHSAGDPIYVCVHFGTMLGSHFCGSIYQSSFRASETSAKSDTQVCRIILEW